MRCENLIHMQQCSLSQPRKTKISTDYACAECEQISMTDFAERRKNCEAYLEDEAKFEHDTKHVANAEAVYVEEEAKFGNYPELVPFPLEIMKDIEVLEGGSGSEDLKLER